MDGRRAIFTDDYLVRYVIHLLLQPSWWFVFSLLEKSSWLLSHRVALLLGVSGSSAVLVASDPVLLAKIWPLPSFGPGVQRSRCTSSYVPIDVASKPYVASLRWDSASSCKIVVCLGIKWWPVFFAFWPFLRKKLTNRPLAKCFLAMDPRVGAMGCGAEL